MTKENLSREELFALVWERPTTEVARDLGISDVALAKLCRRLQVPKPPRGYWARVKAGRTPRRPPLQAYRAESEAERGRRARIEEGRRLLIQLTDVQRTLVQRALAEIEASGADITSCTLVHEGIRKITPDLAAQILIILQNRYEQWVVEKGGTARKITGARQSVSSLVSKLQPYAKDQLILFRRSDRRGARSNDGPAIVVRLSKSLQEQIASLHATVRRQGLSYGAIALGPGDYAGSVRYVYWPTTFAQFKTELCVSAQEIWLQCDQSSIWSSGPDRFLTDRLSIRHLVPVDLLDVEEIRLPPVVPRTVLRRYDKRVKALLEAESLYDSLISATYHFEEQVPDERLALADRLWLGKCNDGPFLSARRAWHQVEDELERWEQAIEAERAELCRDIAGVTRGDIVVANQQGKPVRVQVDSADISIYKSTLLLNLHGKRFRKDGTLGKREEYFTIAIEADPDGEKIR